MCEPTARLARRRWPRRCRAGWSPAPFVPSSNVTLPVGVAVDPAAGVTVAVKVTAWPAVEVLGDAARVVVDPAWLTASGVVPLEVAKLASPP